MRKTAVQYSFSILLLAIMLTGCSQQAKDDYAQAGTDASAAAKETGKAIVDDSRTLSTSARSDLDSAGKKISASTSSSRVALANDSVSAKVMQALLAAPDLKASGIKVDTVGTEVTLSGSVPTQTQKQRAGNIAKDLLGSGYMVHNTLKVSA